MDFNFPEKKAGGGGGELVGILADSHTLEVCG